MNVRRCAVVGGGVIGGGWAARFVLNGLDATVYDPAPGAEAAVRAVFANAERAHAKLTLAPAARRGALRFAHSVAEAVAGADLVQESAPEREDLKTNLLAEIDAHAPPGALVCSSTSGLLPSRLQAKMAHPGRFVVGHPFNPVYLLPLVEVCAGAATTPETVRRAIAFYAGLGMHPLHVRHEVAGFIADRLLEALWREALWLVHDGVATTAEVDDAIRYGAGLRWSFMGTFLTYRLAGGEAGMRHFMEQFGPALQLPWTRLTDVPELTPGFVDEIARQSDDQAAGADLRTLERLRDDCLVAVMQALKTQRYASGALLAAQEERFYAAAHPPGSPDPAAPLRLHEGTVLPEWVDYNNHLTESRYLQVFGDATDGLLRLVGVDGAYLAAGHSFYTAETHLVHREGIAGLAPFYVATRLLGGDDKRLHVFHSMHHGQSDALLATAEQMLLHVDTVRGRACPALPPVAQLAAGLRTAQRDLPRPEQAGRRVGGERRAGVDSPALARMLDPEVQAFVARAESFYPASANGAEVAENRATYDRMAAAFRQPHPPGVTAADEAMAATEPDRSLRLRRHSIAGARPGLAMLYLHGGGYVVGGLDSHDDVCAELCAGARVVVVSLDYRLAPEHTYPAALDDAEAAYRHLVASGLDVVVGGDSAGAGLAAALCLRLARLGDRQPRGQVLIYPGLGGDPFRGGLRNLDAPMLRASDCAGYRGAYAGARPVDDDPEFAPLCAGDLRGLAPAAIFAAGVDPLRQDAEDYAALLSAAGVATAYRQDPGLVHGYLRARHCSRVARQAFDAIARAIAALGADLASPTRASQ